MSKVKTRTRFFCAECGAKSPKWTGRCLTCGAWSSLVEEKETPTAERRRGLGQKTSEVVSLKNVISGETTRLRTGLGEFDRVLGGGIIEGSLVLLGGDPGIGKSTLLLQVSAILSAAKVTCLYISGEESLEQIKARAERLNLPAPDLPMMCETDLSEILAAAEKIKPSVLVIDSIQTVYKPDLPGTPGAESQLKEAALSLMVFAKSNHCSVFLAGHVTKGGQIAGPKVIEHMVDTVIYFEGERYNTYRILHSVKNRFGATHEIGVFEMRSSGLIPVQNPSAVFVQNFKERGPGSVVTCSMEGSRPILIEIQALLNRTSYANPQRVATGFDQKRLTIILALLEKFAGIETAMQDVFISIAGGLRIEDPAADLALAAAIASSHMNRPCLPHTIALGELGLNGEVRPVSQLELRIKEALRMGLQKIVIPQLSRKIAVKGAELISARSLQQGLDSIYG
ncbi:DNA repair protein RadA [Fibrobacterota bacterium]